MAERSKLLPDPDGPRNLFPPRGGTVGTITVDGNSATVNLASISVAVGTLPRTLAEILGDNRVVYGNVPDDMEVN